MKRPGDATRLEVDLPGVEVFAQIDGDGVESWLRQLLSDLAPQAASFAVRFVDDEEMRELNRHYRTRDVSTDVLSFSGEDTPEGQHLGDLVVSVPTAKRQADRGRRLLATEVQSLLLHGTLHCLGYDHETDDGEMELQERELCARWVREDGDWALPGEAQ